MVWCRRRIPRQFEGELAGDPFGIGQGASGHHARGRVAGSARPDRRPHHVVGAVVPRLADHAGGSVYASRWEHDGIPLWTVVNRGDDYDGPWLIAEQPAGWHWAE